jgi:hypothetical protein
VTREPELALRPQDLNHQLICTGLIRERARHYSRLERLLEDALIKVSAVASKLDTCRCGT